MNSKCMQKVKLSIKYGSSEKREEIEAEENCSILELFKSGRLEKKDTIVAKVDGVLTDLSARLTKSSSIELLSFESEEGKETFWHSSAHILGQALQNLYGCQLVNGPPIEEGFYYDVYTEKRISSDDFPEIEAEMKRIAKENIPFEKITYLKEELLNLYSDNNFKKYFIDKNVTDKSTVYKNDKFYDLCLGPHLPSTQPVKAVKLLNTSSVYFLNDSKNPSLQRVYAISFPDMSMLKAYVKRVEAAKEMDHRKIGREMDLFFFHRYSPGSCFWLPDGAYIYNLLVDFVRKEYKKRNFQEVITPNIFSIDLWKESGHYENYRDNIYMVENGDMGLKPMNCPGHCIMFRSSEHSFRDLPLRLADFGVLHRNELSGTLTGLTRVRRFQQDDAHIFCTKEQIKDEISGCLSFIDYVYNIFGFSYEAFLSTRPKKYIGCLEEWKAAENALKEALDESGHAYAVEEGDGAFYGPKIDIRLTDAFGRKMQCATIQLDFQLPQRFNLKYTGTDGAVHTPIIIHRAIFGSIERMIAILLESFGKKLPLWLTPRQIAIIPLHVDDYASHITSELGEYCVKIFNDPSATLNKRIRAAQVEGFRILCVIGEKERDADTLSIRVGNSSATVSLAKFKEFMACVSVKKLNINDINDILSLINSEEVITRKLQENLSVE